ncbi:MAG: hypothetical protein HC899_17800 [Leptolyngbyaceae cyanobacterium SM1_4_3]|nr:hypothetical protein [Leptolyngbyaceae cyanobacterium SM1_4_3]
MKIKAIATAFTSTFLLLVAPHVSVAQNASLDQQYLDFLYDSLWEYNRLAYLTATEELTSDEQIDYARSFCASLDAGNTVDSFLSELYSGIDPNTMSASEQEAVGVYWGVMMYGSTLYYCPEYRALVEQLGSSANQKF